MTVLKKLSIKSKNPSFQYSIFIGNNYIQSLENKFFKILKRKKIYVIYDEFFNKFNLNKNLIEKFKKLSSKLSSEVFFFKIKSKDKFKNFENLSILLNFILSHKINRDSVVISIGGGVTGDLVGFASSIVLRGVKCIHIPTTLLSQVDSSVGGKTGINTKHGKNLVGTFYQPEGVLIDINFLKTLPERELSAGFAEVIKYSFIYDKKFFNYLEKNIESIKKLKSPYIENIIFQSCKIKAKIVSLDEKEQGIRAILNFGHTFAHAFENLTNYDSKKLVHGEAVAIGMACAFKLSTHMNLCSTKEAERCIKLISKFNLPTNLKDIKGIKISSKKLLDKFYLDKKVKNGKITLILSNGIGNALIKNDINERTLKKFLNELINE